MEIGLEEVPARFMPSILEDLKKQTDLHLKDARIDYANIKTLGTPRRLTLVIEDIAKKQSTLHEKLRGPSFKVAYDEEKKPTKALLGFMRGQGVSEENLITEEINGTPYVFAEKCVQGEEVVKLLPEILKSIILSLSFQKPMRWADQQAKFVRPIHWIVSLLDDEVVPFAFESIVADRFSMGHRFLSNDKIIISSAQDYHKLLLENWVMVDGDERKNKILSEMEKIAQETDLWIQEDQELLEEVVYLLEYPTVLMGSFEQDFLNMPPELIITPMKEHQRYFPVFESDKKKLTNKFVTVRNGNDEHIDTVRRGNENVLRARLEDALFFYNEDLKKPLEENYHLLKNIIFQEKLGTLDDKCKRLQNNVIKVGECIGFSEETTQNASLAAYLCKADLVSLVVTEFPELQGIMGEYYILAQKKYPDVVGQAVREHYMPRFSGDKNPESEAGVLISVVDKMDTIVGCFGAGIEPTGSQDPYALRRQASGIVAILLEHGINVSLKDLIKISVDSFISVKDFNYEQLEEKVYQFFEQRIRNVLLNMDYDVPFIRAILAPTYDRVISTVKRAQECHRWVNADEETFKVMLMGFKRAHNLTKDHRDDRVDPSIFENISEKTFYTNILISKDYIEAYTAEEKYGESLKTFLDLTPYLEHFFEETMVMVDDDLIKNNRLSLLVLYKNLIHDILDVTQM